MKVFDTSVYVVAFLPADAQHSRAKKLFATIDEQIILPSGVLAEVLTVLTYKHSRGMAEEFASYVFEDSRFTLVKTDTLEEFYFWKSMKVRLSFVDMAVIFVALKYGIELITFDDQQQKLF